MLEIKNDSNNHFINQYFKKKKIKQSKDYKVQYVKISNENNLSAYMIIEQSNKSISIAKQSKKAKSSHYEVTFAGLRQPTKNVSMETYSILSKFLKRFKIADMDICFDGTNELEVNQKNISIHQWICKDYIASNKDTEVYRSSFYINKPQNVENDADRYKKILLYDKYIKETSRGKILDSHYKNWKRLEVTIKVDAKLEDFMIKDYLLDISNLARKYFDVKDFNFDYIELQLLLLSDGRKHSKEHENNLNKSFINYKAQRKETQRRNSMNDLETNKLIDTIKDKNKKLNAIMVNMFVLWFEIGSHLIQLKSKLNCTQNDLCKIVGLSKGGIYNFMKIAQDERFKRIFNDSHRVGIDNTLKSLENFSQKRLVKLTKLDDVAFNNAITVGKLPAPNSEMRSIKMHATTVTLKEHYIYEEKIQKLEAKVELLENEEVIKPSPKRNNSKKAVRQINITTGDIIETFESISTAAIRTKIIGSSISKCANGEYTHAGGYWWKFIDAPKQGTANLFTNY